MTINWEITNEDFDMLVLVADRALHDLEYPDDKRTLIMDLNACHSNGCPLDLASLLIATLQDFSHDIHGIREHINHDTGRLENCFVPRYALGNRVPVSTLPGGVVFTGGTPDQHDLLRKRGEFVAQYCAAKGWDAERITMQQVMEIRSQRGWKEPAND